MIQKSYYYSGLKISVWNKWQIEINETEKLSEPIQHDKCIILAVGMHFWNHSTNSSFSRRDFDTL